MKLHTKTQHSFIHSQEKSKGLKLPQKIVALKMQDGRGVEEKGHGWNVGVVGIGVFD
jgi:hypothetical protein